MPTYETFAPPNYKGSWATAKEYTRVCEENDVLWSIFKTCPGCKYLVKGIVYGCEIQRHINLSGHCNQFESTRPDDSCSHWDGQGCTFVYDKHTEEE